jgi:predicted phosphohydrolase
MSLYAISDLHLPGNQEKPMDIFGDHWADHWQQISDSWKKNIDDNDIVLIAGDISWAMNYDDVQDDIDKISSMPGHKVIIKGNHDYWWQSLTKLRNILPAKMYAIQNDAVKIDDYVICGTRGWTCPGTNKFSADDEKIYKREAERLKLSMMKAEREREENTKLAVMMHFPPFNDKQDENLFTQQLEAIKPDIVIYGHLHGFGAISAFEGNLRGVEYKMTACDFINFMPIKLL